MEECQAHQDTPQVMVCKLEKWAMNDGLSMIEAEDYVLTWLENGTPTEKEL